MEPTLQWIRKGQGIAFGRQGNDFHIIHDYQITETEITAGYHVRTTNAREAVIHYATAISERITRSLLQQLEADGYNPVTGTKQPEPKEV